MRARVVRRVAALAAALAASCLAYAGDPAPAAAMAGADGAGGATQAGAAAAAAPAPGWAARAQAGYSRTGGNTDTSSGELLLHVAHVVDHWKVLFGVEGVYGSTAGETTAQSLAAHLQANDYLTPATYWYSGLRYDDNRFSGFDYQAAVKTGLGRHFIDSDTTRLTAQAGIGYRWLRPEILVRNDIGAIVSATPLATESQGVLDAGVRFEHAFNDHTRVVAYTTVLAGSENTLTAAGVSLEVKMTGRLALAAGYELTDNSKPPQGSVRTNSMTTVSLVYELRNETLAPD